MEKKYYLTIFNIGLIILVSTIGILTITDLTNENDSLKTELGTEKHYSSTLYNSSVEQISNITKLQLNLNNLNLNYSKLILSYGSLTNNLTLMTTQNELLNSDNERILETLQTVSTEKTVLENESEKQLIEIDLYKIILNEARSNYLNLNKTNTELKLEIFTYKVNISDLQEKINNHITQVNGLQTEINNLLLELNQPNTDLDNLMIEYNNLLSTYTTLQGDYRLLSVSNHNLGVEAETLQFNFNILKEKWDIWRQHADVEPISRTEYEITGYIPYSGDWFIEKDSIIISFPDPENCLSVGILLDTGSMRPAMGKDHEIIETTCFTENDLHVGDIITFSVGQYTDIVHQIIEIVPEGYITKGINNIWEDPWIVKFTDIESIVVAIIY